MLIGYGRTSTLDQIASFQDQKATLLAAGCERIYEEQVSSVVDRPQLAAMLAYVREGDVVVVTKIDRLARNLQHLLEIAEELNAKGAGLRILGSPIDTSNAAGKMMLSVFGAFAQFERELMLERQKIGIKRAKAEGKYKGRAPTAARKADEVRALAAEKLGPVEIAEKLGISRTSVWRILNGKAIEVTTH